MATEAWYALRVRSNSEKSVVLTIRGKGITEYLPLQRKLSRWSDRNKLIEVPLFPGYVFSRFNPDRRLPLLTIPGVIQVVGSGGVPEAIRDEEIDAVRRVVDSGFPVESLPYVQAGDVVRVMGGTFAGMEGVLTEVKNRYRLVVSLPLLQRSVSVEIDRDQICRVTTPHSAVYGRTLEKSTLTGSGTDYSALR